MDFSKVKPWLRKAVKKVLCIGSCRHHLANLWQDATSCEPCDNFQQAVQKAVASAQSGDTVLLSPACSSHDMFTDYAERGRIFIELISKELRK